MCFIKFLKVILIILIPFICIFLGFSILLIFFHDLPIVTFIEQYEVPQFIYEMKYFYIELAALAGDILLLIIFNAIIKAGKRRQEEINRRAQEHQDRLKKESRRRKDAAADAEKYYGNHYKMIAERIADRHDFDYRIKITGSGLIDKYDVYIYFYFYDCNHRGSVTLDSIHRELKAELEDNNPVSISFEVNLIKGYKK